MTIKSNIEWTDSTWNPWEGCTKVSPGCDNCYAEARNARFAGGESVNWGPGAPRRRTSVNNWNEPRRWNAKADAFLAEHGRRQRVFCASLADVFDNAVPVQWRIDLMKLIVETPRLDWLLLTKRIGNAAEMLDVAFRAVHAQRETWVDNVPPNVWIGATIVNQEEAVRDIPKLLAVPARVRFLSMEPLLGPVALPFDRLREWNRLALLYRQESVASRIDWVIVGGESGPGARPMHPDWARGIRDQCEEAGVPMLFKQWGEWGTAAQLMSTGEPVFREFPCFQTWVNKGSTWVNGGICLDRQGRELKNGGDMRRASEAGDFPVTVMHKVGKKAAGRLLDGRTWDGVPTA